MLNLTPSDQNFLAAMRIQSEPDPIPFDAKAAEAMIELHRIAEARQRDRAALLEIELAHVKAAFQRWIVSDRPAPRWPWEAMAVGMAVGVAVGLVAGLVFWGRG